MTSAVVAVVIAAVLIRLSGLAVAALVAGSLDKAVFGWDGALYLQIARNGYPPGLPLAAAANWAFFPAWPAVLAVLVRVPLSPAVLVVAWGVVLTIVDVLLLVDRSANTLTSDLYSP